MAAQPKAIRCAVYTRKSTEHNLDLEFNSLDAQRETVEFDIRLKTFAMKGDGYVLCVKLAGASIETAWLIPASELEGVARQSSTDFIVVASAKPTSKDRFSRYRASSFEEIPARILTPRAG
jgi:hypothetical protein